ncbi:glycosyl transferase [Sphingomonas metalli]|uniref:Glycosyl transferase n=1 Tax=Sphingomonas metalli TaxID=1779358 RepID=A0A916WWI5_9SPHN|nr:glycosyl transferase [Sphingomonas metalli]
MAEKPFVSVALATYNGERWLREQLESIYAQQDVDVEIIASDDASTDGTRSILEEYRDRCGLILLPAVPNLGYKNNFARAIAACTAPLIALADQDDIWDADKLRSLVRELGNDLLVHADVAMMDENGLIVAPSVRRRNFGGVHDRVFLDRDYHIASLLTRKSLCQGCTALFRRELLDTAFPVPANEQAHDIWLAFVAAAHTRVHYIDRSWVRWRVHGANTSQAPMRSPSRSFFKGTFVNGLARRVFYYRRAAILRKRGVRLGLYPLRLRDELF